MPRIRINRPTTRTQDAGFQASGPKILCDRPVFTGTLEALRNARGAQRAGGDLRLSLELLVSPYGQCMAGWRAIGTAVGAGEIFLMVDRGSAHRAKKVSAFVHTLGGKLRLFFLPPCSPDRNPDELVWKHLKADTLGRMAMSSKVDFTKKVRRSMRDLQNARLVLRLRWYCSHIHLFCTFCLRSSTHVQDHSTEQECKSAPEET